MPTKLKIDKNQLYRHYRVCYQAEMQVKGQAKKYIQFSLEIKNQIDYKARLPVWSGIGYLLQQEIKDAY